MPKPYTVTDTQKLQFAGIYLLEYMASNDATFPLLLNRDEQDLEPILEWLLVRKHVEIIKNERYQVTDWGRQALGKFAKRYSEYLRNFDVYAAVDLGAGEFAFARYYDFATDGEWKDYLRSDRWEDLRVAVAEFKGMDPVESVFMSFLNEKRFGKNERGWQFDLLLGTVWDQILEICNNALTADDLGYEDVPGEAVLEDVIRQGAHLLIELFEQEENHQRRQWDRQDDEDDEDETWGGESLRYDDKDFDRHKYEDPRYRPPEWRDRWSM
jgi:hypothetical protein